MTRRDVVVVGAGHNGLVAACYLARAGLDVEVVERDAVPGGAVSTVERWPGVRVDRGSTLHVVVRHSGIVDDLALHETGLDYIDVDPWAVAPADGATLRFGVDVDDTCASIAAICGEQDAQAYADLVREWSPRLDAMLDAFRRPPTAAGLARAFWPLGRRVGRGGGELARTFLTSADRMLDATFRDDRLKTALGWWAAQAGPAPDAPGTAPLVATAFLMHRRAPGRPRGGSGMLSAALAERLRRLGGSVRLGDGAVAVLATAGRVTGVRTAAGDVVEARAVLAACHVVTTLRLLGDEALLAASLPRLALGHGLGMVARLHTSALPAYPGAGPDTHTGMQLLATSRGQLRTAYSDFLCGRVPEDPPLLVLTPTATDASLAPAGEHVVTVWTQWHPRHPHAATWAELRDRELDRLVTALDRHAPGFAGSVRHALLQTPQDLEDELGLVGGNVLHLEMTLDAMFALRPVPEWSGYRGPRPGLYLTGASTHPGGGVSGLAGRSAAQVVLRDLRRRRR